MPTSSHHETSLDRAVFRAPNAEPRIAPFWFWNCAMDEERIRRQVRQMTDAGIGGFFIHPRQGLTLPYLSDEWFARVRVAVEAARECGLQAWLYDEYPYPSGIAGGLLTANHPEFRARVLDQSTLDAAGGVLLRHEFPLGRIISALAVPIEAGRVLWDQAQDIRKYFGVVLTREQFWHWPMGHIPYNEKRFMADEGRQVLHWTPPPGEWKIFVGIETEQRGFKYYDCFFDPLCPGAAQEFLRLTHERYAEHLGEYFGNTIPGIFTDEIEPPPWSPQIEAALDLPLAEVLPALKHDDHPRAMEVRHQFRECALQLFQERWEKPVADWCASHNLIWGAEKPTWRPAQFWNIAEPSTDAGHRRIGAPPEPLTAELRANHRAAMAGAEQSGTERVRCECFHSLGWGATLQDQKWQIDWLTAQGVNRFTPHAFYATSAGLAKHDAAPSFFTENPYWKYFHLLSEYTARLSYAMSCGREVARIAVLHPTAALWRGGGNAHHAREEYEALMNALLREHHIFHPIDALAFRRETAANGCLELGNARYEVLLVPALSADDPDIEYAVSTARAAGLRVLTEDWLAALNEARKLSVADEAGNQLGEVWALWREAGHQQLLFLSNTSDAEVSTHIEIEADANSWQQWFLEDGSIQDYPSEISNGESRMTVQLAPYGSALFVGDNTPALSSLGQATQTRVLALPTDGLWELELDRPNALRLNRWRLACDGGDWSSVEINDEKLAHAEALPLKYRDQTGGKWIEACARAGESTPVWYRRRVSCEFVPEDLALLIEDGAILGDWTLFVNGVAVSHDAFVPIEYHGTDKTACKLAPLLHSGENLLALRVENAPEMGGLRTPLHLIGSFALQGTERRGLVPLPGPVLFNDLVAAGLPHFSGTAIYRRTLPENLLKDVATIELPRGFQDIAEIKIGGRVLGVRAWTPYRWELSQRAHDRIELEIAVTNTLLPFVEGRQWVAPTQQLREV
jgi:hypothetical protein